MQSPLASAYQKEYVLNSEQSPAGNVAFYADGAHEIIHVNHYVVSLFACDTLEEFLELTQGSFDNFVCEEDREAVLQGIDEQVAHPGKHYQAFYRARTKRGDFARVIAFGRLEPPAGEKTLGDKTAASPHPASPHPADKTAASQRPVLHTIIARASALATTDWLTGLPSMVHFHSLARAGAANLFAQGERPVAVALDIMGMKDFNTRFGRDEGDRLLYEMASVLRVHFGPEACSRFAEDHYYAFAAEAGIEQRLRAVFDDFQKADRAHVPPVRAGIYALEPNDDIVAQGFDQAKLACDLDRTTWQSHFTWFTDEMREAARRRIHVLESLDQALAQGWIQPYYQPIVRSATGEVCNEEALARWMDPEFGALYPDQFIPDLEEAGLLYKLDLHIVDCVIRDLLMRRRNGVPLVPVSMNFSLRDLMGMDLASEIARRADAAGIARGLLCVELTESVASTDPDFLREQLKKLHAAGFEVWMDDFGSGYSSLNTLQEFDFDLIKLDMAFLRSKRVEKAHVIMAGVIQAAGRLGVATLTEGVETLEQAAFLESIGCDKLQGYYFAKPQSLGEVIGRHAHDGGDARERYDARSYWDTVSLLSLSGASSDEQDAALDGGPLLEHPAGVIERRDNRWRVLRGNQPFYELLDRQGILSMDHSNLQANDVERPLEPEVDVAAQRALDSGLWERIAGHIEQGERYQFFIRHIASTDGADSFQFAAMPTMLGAALGAYGDVPLAYAVFRVHMNDEKTEVVDTEYVYANDLYHAWCGFVPGELAGKSFLNTQENADAMWFPYCYRAVAKGEHVHDVVYSPEIGHWLTFYLAPTPIENCCVYAFAIVDDERREREEMVVGRDTSDLIIRFADLLNGGMGYHELMEHFLALLSEVVHPDRMHVYEREGDVVSRPFEWCAPGVESHAGVEQDVPLGSCSMWDELFANDSILLVPDVERLRDVDEHLYASLVAKGVRRILAFPLYHDGELVGYVGADNYDLEESLDTKRLLESVAPFLSARIVVHRLLKRFKRLGTHDELTGILNRQGVDLAIREQIEAAPTEPYALALIDIDDFKLLNDVNGYDVGDSVLRQLSASIASMLPEEAVFGRNGGDEFVIMLPGARAADAARILTRIVEADKSFEYQGRRYATPLSIGYVCCPEQTGDLRLAYSMADTALYAVKLSGKAGLRRYASEMETQYRRNPGFTPVEIAAHVPGSIVVHLPGDGKILFANDELVSLFECDSLAEFLELTGGTYGGMIHPDDRQRVHDELAEQMSLDDVGGKDFVDYRIVTKAGNVVHVANNGRLVEIDGIGKAFYELLINREERGIR